MSSKLIMHQPDQNVGPAAGEVYTTKAFAIDDPYVKTEMDMFDIRAYPWKGTEYPDPRNN